MVIVRTFAEHEKSKFWSKLNIISPDKVALNSNKKFWFDCECGHIFESKLNHINSGSFCPYCANKKLCNKNECTFCFNNSFASHEKAIYWSNKNQILPRFVFKQSCKKFWFDCECGHIFESNLNHINSGNFCPYCANKKLCNKNECTFCFNNSFASSNKAQYWSNKNQILPRFVFKRSNTKYLFDCDKCGHIFESKLNHINSGSFCPYCANKKLCDKSECVFCFNNSFAANPLSKYWSNKNNITPRQVSKGNGNKFIFNCNLCNNEFLIRLDSIRNNNWCSCSVNKTEQKLYEHLLISFEESKIIRQFKQDWCKRKTYLPFDFCLEEYNIIIEVDGPQRWIQISNWSSPEENQANDLYKQKCANENGYSTIRILQENIWFDRYDWFNKLLQNIEKIIEDNIVQNIYMCKNNEYTNYLHT